MRIVVNTISTKKHSGGAFQIAYNFLMESLKHQDEAEWYYITSEDVDEVVGEEFKDQRGKCYFVFPTQPDFKESYRQVKKQLAQWENTYKPDIIYTISSPCYFTFKTTEVMRFANAWMTNPNKYAWKSMPWKSKLRMYIYRLNQFRMLKKSQFFITQSEAVKKGLLHITGLPDRNIKVVPNVLPMVFANAIIEKNKEDDWIDVNCAAAPVPHKNLDLIPDVLINLEANHGITNVRFHLTIHEGNILLNRIKGKCKYLGMEENIVNHGRCTQQQLIAIYNQCDMCFLPTLLETFSASSLEAMKFQQYIVATDFEFNREVIGDAGLYYKPMDARDAANKLALIIKNEAIRQDMKEKMSRRIKLYDDYKLHFSQIVDFLKELKK